MEPRSESLERQVAQQHRQLDTLFEETLLATREERDPERALTAFTHLQEALETHFFQEDHLYYPPIWALRPQQKLPLLDFIENHQHFRELLMEIFTQIEGGALEIAARRLDEFLAEFSAHEFKEEKLLRTVDGEFSSL